MLEAGKAFTAANGFAQLNYCSVV